MGDIARETDVDPALQGHLPRAAFSDSFSLEIAESSLDAMTAARRIMDRTPDWVAYLMHLRNFTVAPFGLKTKSDDETRETIGTVISFPIISKSPGKVVVGLDDKHLDFRLIVETMAVGASVSRVRVTTFVAPHNLLGRSYLAAILPFHRHIVPAMLNRVHGP